MSRITYHKRTDSQEAFEECYKDIDRRTTKISHKKYKQVIDALNIYYATKTVKTGNLIALPHGMGRIGVNKNPVTPRIKAVTRNGTPVLRGMMVDYNKTKEVGVPVYHTNADTSGYIYSIRWLKTFSKLTHPSFWKVEFTRFFKRDLLCKEVRDPNSNMKDVYRHGITDRHIVEQKADEKKKK